MHASSLALTQPQAANTTVSQRLPSPHLLKQQMPLSSELTQQVHAHRQAIRDILEGRDQRLLVIVGPCSIHDPRSALEYADRLAALSREVDDKLLLVMRAYVEKPRTTVGWKGLAYDPHLDGSDDMHAGIALSRGLMLNMIERGLPVATELLQPMAAGYFDDLLAWAAIGARTTESQIHREMVSGLELPVGFKNGTDGNVQVAVDGVKAAAAQHVFFGMDDLGRGALVRTAGNADCHVILRGGTTGPNYGAEAVRSAADVLDGSGLPGRVVVDCSHANSGKDHVRQAAVAAEVAQSVRAGLPISGVMLESFLVAGAQSPDARPLTYGQSVTDACMDWPTTDAVLRDLARAVTPSRR